MIKKIIQFVKKYAVALAGSLYLFTFGLLGVRHRVFLLTIAEHFGFREGPAMPPAILPGIRSDEIVSGAKLELSESTAEDGNVSLLELLVLSASASKKSARTLFEIGTYDGRTALNLAINTPSDAKIYTLDLPPEAHEARKTASDDIKFVGKAKVGERFHGHSLASKITQLFGDSATFNYTPYEKKIDFVFIDGSHHYDHVVADTKSALRMTRPGSVIFWHDYDSTSEGVTRALNEMYRSGGAFKNIKRIRGTVLAYLVR